MPFIESINKSFRFSLSAFAISNRVMTLRSKFRTLSFGNRLQKPIHKNLLFTPYSFKLVDTFVRNMSGCGSTKTGSEENESNSVSTKLGHSKAARKLAALSGDESLLSGLPGSAEQNGIDGTEVSVLKEAATGHAAVLQRAASIVTTLVERTVSTSILHVGVHAIEDAVTTSTSAMGNNSVRRDFPYYLGASTLFDIIGVTDSKQDVTALRASGAAAAPTMEQVRKETAQSNVNIASVGLQNSRSPQKESRVDEDDEMAEFLRGDGNLDVDDFGRIVPRNRASTDSVVNPVQISKTVTSNKPKNPSALHSSASAAGQANKPNTKNIELPASKRGYYSQLVLANTADYQRGQLPFPKYKFHIVLSLGSEGQEGTPFSVKQLLQVLVSGGYAIIAIPKVQWEMYGLLEQVQDLNAIQEADLLSVQQMDNTAVYLALVRRL